MDGYTLGLDISSVSTGWAIMLADQLVAHGLIKMKYKQPHGERLVHFEQEISKLIELYKPEVLGLEDAYFGRNVKTYKVLCLYHGVAYRTWWLSKTIMPIIATPSELRKKIQKATGVQLTGARKRNKQLVYDYIIDRFDLDTFEFNKHNDITDAIAVALSASLPAATKRKKKIIKKVKAK